MNRDQSGKMEKDIRKAVIRASKHLVKYIESQPSIILLNGEGDQYNQLPTGEIRQWLFHRRPEDDTNS
jgi:hypothetical protein